MGTAGTQVIKPLSSSYFPVMFFFLQVPFKRSFLHTLFHCSYWPISMLFSQTLLGPLTAKQIFFHNHAA